MPNETSIVIRVETQLEILYKIKVLHKRIIYMLCYAGMMKDIKQAREELKILYSLLEDSINEPLNLCQQKQITNTTYFKSEKSKYMLRDIGKDIGEEV